MLYMLDQIKLITYVVLILRYYQVLHSIIFTMIIINESLIRVIQAVIQFLIIYIINYRPFIFHP
jgi:hypothetical protein